MNSKNLRNGTIDLMKLISALAVVGIHVGVVFSNYNDITNLDNEVILSIFRWGTRFAVPFFALTSGYFWYKRQNELKIYVVMKYYLFFIVSLKLFNFFSVLLLGINIRSYGEWYLLAIAVIMLLTMKQNKLYLTLLFVFSLLVNVVNGYLLNVVGGERL